MHEDIVAFLKPRWLFMTAVVTTCWWQKNKKGNVFEDTGDTRTGCLVLLHADRLAATDEPATTDVARLDELFAAPSVNLQLQRCPYYHFDSFKRIILQGSTGVYANMLL